jgi:NAD(P)-dependent dehydrogenase (short-subunit alcohol dehydrogenase family)
MTLRGAVAVVTGASRGIGKGVAQELGAAGATVYITGRTLKAGEHPLPGTVGATAEEVSKLGGQGIAVACDHRDDAAVARLFERVADEQGGRLDVLVNNAFQIPKELTSGKPFWESPLSNWDDMVGVGTRSAYVASWHAVKLMLPHERGLIANISSSGATEYAWHVAYGVGKCALDRFTADAAHELAGRGIAVVSLWPGLVLTERLEGAAKAGIPGFDFTRAESPRFTGRAVVALASDANATRWSGRALAARELADAYGFTDVDGRLPGGPFHGRPKSAGITTS